MAMSSITTRMDSTLKSQFADLMANLGLDMSTFVVMAVKQAVREQGIPFKVTMDVPNKETIQAMNDVENGVGLSKGFNSVEELMADLEADSSAALYYKSI